MKREIILGVDTSNYTSSLALIEKDGTLIANLKAPLPVKAGDRGLRQSDAVFAHVKNIPSLTEKMRELLDGDLPTAVGVSTRPRNIDGSYMPCFLTGVALAEGISSSLGVPLHRFSHQCGHIMAAVYSSGHDEILAGDFSALHISGGTTEILKCKFSDGAFQAELVGGTADLNAGQVIDRVGVSLGMPFPAGRYMEAEALNNIKPLPKKKPTVKDMKVNLSGLENLAGKLYRETCDKAYVAAFVFDYIERSLLALCEAYREKYGSMPFLFAGGVMSNTIIRKSLEEKLGAYFAEPEFSADNAVGIAELTRRKHYGV